MHYVLYNALYALVNNFIHSYNILQSLHIHYYTFRMYNALKYMTNKLHVLYNALQPTSLILL